MPLEYSCNLLVLGCQTIPSVPCNLNLLKKNTCGSAEYRGTVDYKRENITCKFAKKGYCQLFISGLNKVTLQEIEETIVKSCFIPLEKFTSTPFRSLYVSVLNLQITFKIYFDRKSISFNSFFMQIYELCKDKYTFEVKESESFESAWIAYTSLTKVGQFSTFRIKHLREITFTVRHNFSGSSITKDPLYFLELCEIIRSVLTD